MRASAVGRIRQPRVFSRGLDTTTPGADRVSETRLDAERAGRTSRVVLVESGLATNSGGRRRPARPVMNVVPFGARLSRERWRGVEAALPALRRWVKELSRRYGFDLIESFAFGSVVLSACALTFDPDNGVAFETYAYQRVRGEIIDALTRERQIQAKERGAGPFAREVTDESDALSDQVADLERKL